MFESRYARRGAAMLAMAILLLSGPGCATRLERPVPQAEPAIKPPPPVEMPDPDPLPPPPSEAELAFDAARRAELRGDGAEAAALYARAAGATLEAPRRAEALYRLALIHLEPGLMRDLEQGRAALKDLLVVSDADRAREARALLALMDDAEEARVRSAAIQQELDAANETAKSLRADLEKKNQELESIRQVLLQRKP